MAVEGFENLRAALKELGDLSSAEGKSLLRASVAGPGKKVLNKAMANIARISPGKTPLHRTYLGRLVSQGFASRNIKMRVRVDAKRGTAVALIGVVKEAFYALSFFELGLPSRGIARQPWLVPALENQQSTAINDVGASMLKRIKAIAKKRAKLRSSK